MASYEEAAVRPPSLPPDWMERRRALDPGQSFLVQAPAGSGKTYLLTQRFLRLLAEADRPDEIVAITFTNAAAAEMRNRVLGELEKAAPEVAKALAGQADADDPDSMGRLARRAMERADLLGWQILDQPAQLRIMTIDAFCRSLALQSPLGWGLLSGLGGRLETAAQPRELYLGAARRTLAALEGADSAVRRSVEALLLWRDNHWKDVEGLIADMLAARNRWYQEFVFARNGDWEALRNRLEGPFRRAAVAKLTMLGRILDGLEGCREYALQLAREACCSPGKSSPLSLAERVELAREFSAEDAAEAIEAHRDLAQFLLTSAGTWRKRGGVNVNHGYPPTPSGKQDKERFLEFVEVLSNEPGLEAALAAFLQPMPLGYTEEEWELLRHCFTVLRTAAVELQLAFAEAGAVDFTEVAQIAHRILAEEDGAPSDFAIRQADGIRHLLIDEFQDTSRSQHELLSRLIAAWPEREGRSCFCVGDPMQSIYSFREAEVELFERTKSQGLRLVSPDLDARPLLFEPVMLRANFRTAPSLVEDLNGHFARVFALEDGSGVAFSPVEPARESISAATTELHLTFTGPKKDEDGLYPAGCLAEETSEAQTREIVGLIRSKLESAAGEERFRIAVLGRTRSSLLKVAEGLRDARIGFRAIDLVPLRDRPEVRDALNLARALLNPVDRTAWLGVLRAPWCGLSLEELHLLTSADDAAICSRPVPELLGARLEMLRDEGRMGSRGYAAASRVGGVMRRAMEMRGSAAGAALGTWLESVWKALGGSDAVNREERENLGLLWAALDKLPQGELDLLGPGLDAALKELFAAPDPAASSERGVQLMTIHKAKGLEFEVVIVPDLEAKGRSYTQEMMSWLERGLTDDVGDGEALTEFLIAPIQAKGKDAGEAKAWVDRVKRERETQELRRVLYVAATRAREELHLFARPQFVVSKKTGVAELCKATGLLATAWPAFEEEVKRRFEEWVAEVGLDGQAAAVVDLAAVGESNPMGNLLTMPNPAAGAMVRRLPEDSISPGLPEWVAGSGERGRSSSLDGEREDGPGMEQAFARSEGGLESRVLGTAIHGLLERLSRLGVHSFEEQVLNAELAAAHAGVVAAIRGRGFSLKEAERMAAEASSVARRAATEPVGAWILSSHREAEAESSWTGFVPVGQSGGREKRRNLRPDRVFLAKASPELKERASGFELPEEAAWWVIDYKTSHATIGGAEEREKFLAVHRAQYSGQLSAYAHVLRGLIGGESNLRVLAGIYYPVLGEFEFWEA